MINVREIIDDLVACGVEYADAVEQARQHFERKKRVADNNALVTEVNRREAETLSESRDEPPPVIYRGGWY